MKKDKLMTHGYSKIMSLMTFITTLLCLGAGYYMAIVGFFAVVFLLMFFYFFVMYSGITSRIRRHFDALYTTVITIRKNGSTDERLKVLGDRYNEGLNQRIDMDKHLDLGYEYEISLRLYRHLGVQMAKGNKEAVAVFDEFNTKASAKGDSYKVFNYIRKNVKSKEDHTLQIFNQSFENAILTDELHNLINRTV